MRRWLCALALVVVAVSPGLASVREPRIDRRVLEDTADGRVGKFLVILRAQTNARALALSAHNSAARGRIVFDALRQIARATQSPVRAQLDALGVR